VADDSRSKTPGRWAPFVRREMPGRWKESLGAPRLGFFGNATEKSERGREKGKASSNIQRKQTWKARKLKRAVATLASEKEDESRRRSWPRRLNPLKRRSQAGRFGSKAHERKVLGKPKTGYEAGIKPWRVKPMSVGS